MATILKAIVDDGTREIPLLNQYGKEICKVYFRPADFSILERVDEVAARLPSKLSALSGIELTNDGKAKKETDLGILKEAEEIVKKEFNYLLDMDEADAIFAKRSAFSCVGGRFFCQLVLDALGDVVTNAVQEEAALAQKRMAKYTDDLPGEVNADAGTTPENP